MVESLLIDDSFVHAATTAGGAGSTSGVPTPDAGAPWTDLKGGVWSIPASGTLQGIADGGGFAQDWLARPADEAHAEARMVVTLANPGGPFLIGLRFDRATRNGYVAYINGSVCFLCTFVGGALATLASFAYNPGSDPYTFDFAVTGTNPTTLTATVTPTGGPAASGAITDSTASLQTAGTYALSINDGTRTVARVRTYTAEALNGPTPGVVSTSAVSGTGLTVATTAATGGTAPYAYQFQRAADSGGTPGVFANVGPNSSATSYDDSGLVAASTYWYRCVATDAGGLSGTSAAVAVTTPAAPATAFTFSGPTGGTVGVASGSFTVTPNGAVASATITPSDGGAGGAFSPTSLTWTGSSVARTFTYTPASAGSISIGLAVTAGTPVTISPASLAYAASIKNFLVFDGDSLTYGVDASFESSYPDKVLDFLGAADWDGVNLGVQGQTLADMRADAVSQVDSLFNAARPYNIVCVLGGTNDMGGSPAVDAATAYGRLVAYGQARRAAGWKVVALTVPPANLGGGSFNAVRDTFNGLVRSGWPGFADALADLAAEPAFADGGETNPTYFAADQVHCVDPGYALFAGRVVGAIASITRQAGGDISGEIDDVTAQQIIDATIAGILANPTNPLATDATGRVALQPAQPGVTIPAVATVAAISDKSGYSLAPTGLDAIAVSDPGAPANHATLPRMLVALWRRAFKKSTMTAGSFQMYADDNVSITCAQAVSDDGAAQTMESAT